MASSGLKYSRIVKATPTLIEYFKEHKALSPISAIIVDDLWFENIGADRDSLRKITYIKTTDEGKYWLDESELSIQSEFSLSALLAVIFIPIIILVMIYLFYR